MRGIIRQHLSTMRSIFQSTNRKDISRLSPQVTKTHLRQLLGDVTIGEVKLNSIAIKNVINSLDSLDDVELAMRVLQRVVPSPDLLTPDVASLVIKCYGKIRRPVEAYEFYRSASLIPGLIVEKHLTVLLKALHSSEMVMHGIAVYKEMVSDERNFPRAKYDVILAGSVLNLCKSIPQRLLEKNPTILNEATDILQHITAGGLRPDQSLYSSLIHIAGRTGHFDAAENWFATMNQSGLPQTVQSMNAILEAANLCEKYSTCFEIYNQMLAAEIVPDSFSLLQLLKSCLKTDNRIEGVQHLSQWMKNGGFPSWELIIFVMDNLATYARSSGIRCSQEHSPSVDTADCITPPLSSQSASLLPSDEEIKAIRKSFFKFAMKQAQSNTPVPEEIWVRFAPEVVLSGNFDKVFGRVKLQPKVYLDLLAVLARDKQWMLVLSLAERFRNIRLISNRHQLDVLAISLVSLLAADQDRRASRLLLGYLDSDPAASSESSVSLSSRPSLNSIDSHNSYNSSSSSSKVTELLRSLNQVGASDGDIDKIANMAQQISLQTS